MTLVRQKASQPASQSANKAMEPHCLGQHGEIASFSIQFSDCRSKIFSVSTRNQQLINTWIYELLQIVVVTASSCW